MDKAVIKVRLQLFATKLKNVSGPFGCSNPFAVITLVHTGQQEYSTELGKTEVIEKTQSPQWTSYFDFGFIPGKTTRVDVAVKSRCAKTNKTIDMGSAVYELGDVLGSQDIIKAACIKEGGTLFARFSTIPQQCSGNLYLQLRAAELDNVGGLLTCVNPFFEVKAMVDIGDSVVKHCIYRSVDASDNMNPCWSPCCFDLDRLGIGPVLDRRITISVFDWQRTGKHRLIGSFESDVKGLLTSLRSDRQQRLVQFNIMRRSKKKCGRILVAVGKIVDQSSRNLRIDNKHPAMIASTPGFLDYISGGCRLDLFIAIDFTVTNGDPRMPGTLHYTRNGGSVSKYEEAIRTAGSVVLGHCTNPSIPVWGFGANWGGLVRNCFQVGAATHVSSLEGVLQEYRSIVKLNLLMSSPKVCCSVIKRAAQESRKRSATSRQDGKRSYGVLLIFTDGEASDMGATLSTIRSASDAPLSIVIVGVGKSDFSGLKCLENYKKQLGERHNCRFIEFNQYLNNNAGFRQEILESISHHLVEYFSKNGIGPLDRYDVDDLQRSPSVRMRSDRDVTEFEFFEPSYSNRSLDSVSCFATKHNLGLCTKESPSPTSVCHCLDPSTPCPTNPSYLERPKYLHVNVPPNVFPGQLLQIHNPATGTIMYVTVPQGVGSCGSFVVPY